MSLQKTFDPQISLIDTDEAWEALTARSYPLLGKLSAETTSLFSMNNLRNLRNLRIESSG